MHEVFEKITNNGISDEEAIELYRREAEEADLTEKETKNLLEKGETALRISLETFGETLRAQNSRGEVDLRKEYIEVEGVPVVGKLDHIEVDDEKKTIEIFDFKTGKYHKEKWGSVNVLYKYSLQLLFYKLLVEGSTKYKKYKVTRGHILFVTPDEEGKVYDKVFEYGDAEAEEKELRKIIKAVYKQATSLEFLDIPELRVEADKKRDVKEIKEFVKVLVEKSGA